MIAEEEILGNIIEMGYITATPRVIHPSYYRLKDGTILKALVNVNYVSPDIKQPDGFSANTSNVIYTYVPKEKRRPEDYRPWDPLEVRNTISDEDVEFDVLRENLCV